MIGAMFFVNRLRAWIYTVYASLFVWRTLVEGVLAGDEQPIRIWLLMDRDGWSERYLLNRLFNNSWRKIESRRFCLLFVRRLGRKLPAGIEFCFIQLPSLWDRHVAGVFQFRFPVSVKQMLDVRGGIADFKSRMQSASRRNKFNRILREERFTCRVGDTPEDLEIFYHQMYLPHARQQFGSTAWIRSLAQMKRLQPKPFIFYINDGQRDVAASLTTVKDGILTGHYNGVVSDETSDGWSDAGEALYALTILYAQELGLHSIDMLGAQPVLDDPILKYKRSWGAGIALDPEVKKSMYFCNPANSDAARRFISKSPFVVITDTGLKAYCTVPDNLQGLELQSFLKKNYASPGLTGALVTMGSEPGVKEIVFT